MLFIDDLSMPLPEKYGAQPPIELLRQWIDHNHWYDLQTMSRIDILDMVIIYGVYYELFILPSDKCVFRFQIFIGVLQPPGGGSNYVTTRLTRHMNLIGIDSFNQETMSKIFTQIIEWHVSKGFPEAITLQGKV